VPDEASDNRRLISGTIGKETTMSEAERANRRDFLKLAAAGAPVAAVAAVTGGTDAEASVADAGEGLRDTEMTRKYYETARF
jgi:hypothetical protein